MTDSTTLPPPHDDSPGFDLDPVEARVLGVLIEKAFITPDTYPLSINALMTGCNQLTGREPVMSLSEHEVQAAIDNLMQRKLVTRRDSASARVPKYEHQIRLRHSLPPAEQAVLALLLLRGAQTAGEIRQRCERLHRFDDIAAVERVLEHLSEKFPPMAMALPRAPGTKETRWTHLLCGQPHAPAAEQTGDVASSGRGRIAQLEDEVRALREELAALRAEFEQFRQQFD